MRATLLPPAACLMLLAGPAAAQQAAPAPTPPAPAPGQRTAMPHEMGRGMGESMHAHAGRLQAPGLRIRVGGISLDLRCAVGDSREACARTALGIIDHLSQTDAGGTGQNEGGNQDNGGDDGDGGGGDQ